MLLLPHRLIRLLSLPNLSPDLSPFFVPSLYFSPASLIFISILCSFQPLLHLESSHLEREQREICLEILHSEVYFVFSLYFFIFSLGSSYFFPQYHQQNLLFGNQFHRKADTSIDFCSHDADCRCYDLSLLSCWGYCI